MLVLFRILAVISVLATFIAIIEKKAWWIRAFDFPRLQIIILQLVSVVFILLIVDEFNWKDAVITGLTLIALIIQLVYVFPYFPFAPLNMADYNGDGNNTITLMVSNVLMTNRISHKLINHVQKYQPDVLLTVETDIWWQHQLKILENEYPYTVKIPQDNTYGMLLYSKYPLENVVVDEIYRENIPSINAEVVKDGMRIKLYCVHPEPPTPEEADTSRPRDRELIIVGKRIAKDPSPYIIMGDLNDVAWSDTSNHFRKLSKLRDPRMGRGFYNTFHAKTPLFRFALDHFFISDHFGLIELKKLPPMGSDHFPLFIKFGLNKKDQN